MGLNPKMKMYCLMHSPDYILNTTTKWFMRRILLYKTVPLGHGHL